MRGGSESSRSRTTASRRKSSPDWLPRSGGDARLRPSVLTGPRAGAPLEGCSQSPRGDGLPERGRATRTLGLSRRPRPPGPSRGGSLRRDRCEDLARASSLRGEERLARFPTRDRTNDERRPSSRGAEASRAREPAERGPHRPRSPLLARGRPLRGPVHRAAGGRPPASPGVGGRAQGRVSHACSAQASARLPLGGARRRPRDGPVKTPHQADERATFGSRPVHRAGSRAGVPPARDDQATVSLRGGLQEEVARRRMSGGAGSSRGNPLATRLAKTPSAARTHPADAPRGVESSGTERLPRRRPSWAAPSGFFPGEQRRTPGRSSGILPLGAEREAGVGVPIARDLVSEPLSGVPARPTGGRRNGRCCGSGPLASSASGSRTKRGHDSLEEVTATSQASRPVDLCPRKGARIRPSRVRTSACALPSGGVQTAAGAQPLGRAAETRRGSRGQPGVELGR